MGSSTKASVFVRESTGLVKSVTLLDAIMLNLSNMSSGTAIASIGFTMVILSQTQLAGVNLVGTVLVGFLLSIPEIVVYTIMSRRIPKTGGDYVWVSRTIGPIAAPYSFAEYIWGQFSFLALIALSTVFAIGSVGVAEGHSSFLSLALSGNFGGNAGEQFVIAALVFAALVGVNILRPKVGYKVVSIFAIFGILSLLTGAFVLMAAGHQGVANWVNSLQANLTYTSVQASYTGPTFNLWNSVFILPLFAAFTFPWLNAGPAVAPELKGTSTLKWNVPVSAIITFGILLLAFGSMYVAGGFDFITGAFSNPTLVYDYSFNFWTLAMGVAGTGAVSWFIGLGWIIWNMAVLAYAIIIVARYIFAEAFDRFLPAKLADLNRYGSPAYAHLMDMVITIAVIAGVAYFYGTFTSLYGTWILGMVYFATVGGVAAVYAGRNEKGGTKIALQVSGVLMAVVFLFLAYLFSAYPSIWGGNWLAYGYIVSGLVIGAVIYFWSKSYHKSRGIDISLAFKEIPPD